MVLRDDVPAFADIVFGVAEYFLVGEGDERDGAVVICFQCQLLLFTRKGVGRKYILGSPKSTTEETFSIVEFFKRPTELCTNCAP